MGAGGFQQPALEGAGWIGEDLLLAGTLDDGDAPIESHFLAVRSHDKRTSLELICGEETYRIFCGVGPLPAPEPLFGLVGSPNSRTGASGAAQGGRPTRVPLGLGLWVEPGRADC